MSFKGSAGQMQYRQQMRRIKLAKSQLAVLDKYIVVEPNDWKQLGKQSLVIGSPKGGKTTFLLKATHIFMKQGETVIARDLGDFFEFLNLLAYHQIQGFIPKGCELFYNHPNFSTTQYDPLEPETIFQQLDASKINLVFFELFVESGFYPVLEFWSTFFLSLMAWKKREGRGNLPLTVIFDQFNDVAGGKSKHLVDEQTRLVSFFLQGIKNFRRNNIRFVASSHSFSHIEPDLVDLFDCYIIKRNHARKSSYIPTVIQSYVPLFPYMPRGKAIFIDSRRKFNRLNDPELMKPERFYNVSYSGSVDKLYQGEQTRWERSSKMWRTRALKLACEIQDKHNITAYEIAQLWGISEPTYRTTRSYYLRGDYEE